ncbi:MAG: hypothetical protein WC470_00730 [Candidatus Paceibacterota bacterium]
MPFILYGLLRWAFVYYMETTWIIAPERRKILLEVKIPQSVTRPLRAMEMFFNAYWVSYDPPTDWRTTLFEGKVILATSFEMASIEGVPHFYIRIPVTNRRLLEATLYAQYPNVELVEVPDYTATVPQDIPNKNWDMWGCDFMPLKPDVYPLKTYEEFFEERTDTPDEEKRLDPLSNMLELFSKIGKGEYIWFQIIALPISPKEDPFVVNAKKEIDRLMFRSEPVKKQKSFIGELIGGFLSLFAITPADVSSLYHDSELTIPQTAEEKKEELYPAELRLSTGERNVVAAIERKASKISYRSGLRFIYLAKKEVFNGGMKAFGPSFTAQFGSHDTNSLKPWKPTITKVQSPDFFKKSRLFFKKRDLFWRYTERDFAPGNGYLILGSDELATMFHFPGFEVAPVSALNRIEVKKVAAPTTLPVEE